MDVFSSQLTVEREFVFLKLVDFSRQDLCTATRGAAPRGRLTHRRPGGLCLLPGRSSVLGPPPAAVADVRPQQSGAMCLRSRPEEGKPPAPSSASLTPHPPPPTRAHRGPPRPLLPPGGGTPSTEEQPAPLPPTRHTTPPRHNLRPLPPQERSPPQASLARGRLPQTRPKGRRQQPLPQTGRLLRRGQHPRSPGPPSEARALVSPPVGRLLPPSQLRRAPRRAGGRARQRPAVSRRAEGPQRARRPADPLGDARQPSAVSQTRKTRPRGRPAQVLGAHKRQPQDAHVPRGVTPSSQAHPGKAAAAARSGQGGQIGRAHV